MSGEKIKSKSVEEINAEERLRILQLVSGPGYLKTIHDVAVGVDRLEKPSDWGMYLSEKEMELAEKRYPILLQKHLEQAEAESLHQRAMGAAGKEVEKEMESVLAARREREMVGSGGLEEADRLREIKERNAELARKAREKVANEAHELAK